MVKNLKYLREKKKISQQKLASIIGTSQQSVNKYENSYIEPDISTLIAMSKHFSTSVDFLIGNTDIEHLIEPTTREDLNEFELSFIEEVRELTEDERNSLLAIAKQLNSYK